jgi:hypothetical protein
VLVGDDDHIYGLTKNVDKPRVKMNLEKKKKTPIDEVTSFFQCRAVIRNRPIILDPNGSHDGS